MYFVAYNTIPLCIATSEKDIKDGGQSEKCLEIQFTV